MTLAAGTTLGLYQIVSQLSSGSMGVVYEARGPLELDDAIDIATQVGPGLAEARKAGIVHRDIDLTTCSSRRAGRSISSTSAARSWRESKGSGRIGTTVGTLLRVEALA